MLSALKRRLRSVGFAVNGARVMLRTQPHARIHAVVAAGVLGAGAAWRISAGEWALVVLALGLVWVAEALNTALEFLADEVSLEQRERIGRAKDVAAFGVLVAAGVAATVGAIVFWPYVAG